MFDPPLTIAASIDQFMAAKVVAGLSPATIRTYRQRLERYASWLGARPLARWTIRQYIAQLQHEQLAPHTIAAYVRDIGVLCRWLVAEGVLEIDVSANLTPKLPQRRAAHYTVAQLERLLAVCDGRDRAMVLVLLGTGLRLGELCSMRWDRIDWDTGQFTVVGKGNKEWASWLSPIARDAVTQYLTSRSMHDPALWYGRQGPLTSSGVHQVFRRRAVQAGIRADVHRLVHVCRATFAKNYIKRGGTLSDLAALLGHSTLTMAAYYAALADDDLAAKKAAVDPLAAVVPHPSAR
jgi:integrase/recombinase XerD